MLMVCEPNTFTSQCFAAMLRLKHGLSLHFNLHASGIKRLGWFKLIIYKVYYTYHSQCTTSPQTSLHTHTQEHPERPSSFSLSGNWEET